jgi:hypothetical protein
LSGITQVDISKLDLDEPLEYSDTPGIQGILANFTKADPTRRWTPREIADFMSVSSFGPVVVGSPATVADRLEQWVEEADIEGFNLVDVMPPASFGDFVDFVVPELQRADGCGATTKATPCAKVFTAPVRSASATIIPPRNIGGGDRRGRLRV